jgi:hypothetical protein
VDPSAGGGLGSPFRRPPTMGRAGAEPVQELVASLPPRCSLPMAIGGDVIWGRAPGVQHRWASP